MSRDFVNGKKGWKTLGWITRLARCLQPPGKKKKKNHQGSSLPGQDEPPTRLEGDLLTWVKVSVPFATSQRAAVSVLRSKILTVAVWRPLQDFFFFSPHDGTFEKVELLTGVIWIYKFARRHDSPPRSPSASPLSTWWAGFAATAETPRLKLLSLGTSWGSFDDFPPDFLFFFFFLPPLSLFIPSKEITHEWEALGVWQLLHLLSHLRHIFEEVAARR